MRVTLHNYQKTAGIEGIALKRLTRDLAALATVTLRLEQPWREVAIHLLDDEGISERNRAVMGREGATDVITQRYDPLPHEPDGVVGEIFLNVEQAIRMAPKRAGWTIDHELALYLAHGIDHLAEEDDTTPAGRARMRRRELRWLRKVCLTPLLRLDTLKANGGLV